MDYLSSKLFEMLSAVNVRTCILQNNDFRICCIKDNLQSENISQWYHRRKE